MIDDRNIFTWSVAVDAMARLVAGLRLAVQQFLGATADAPEEQHADGRHHAGADQAEKREFAQDIGGFAHRIPDDRHHRAQGG